MRVLVTGGAGFIGSDLCRYLVQEVGVTVLNVDKLTYAANLASLREIEESSKYHFLRRDICDQQAMADAFSGFEPHGVIHLAAETHVDRSIINAGQFISTNVIGTFSLLEAARGYWSRLSAERKKSFRFLHVSTDEVYGSLGAVGLFGETSAYDPSSPYAASKAASDHLVSAWCRTYGLPVLVTNCSNNFGPYHFPEKLIPLMILNALEGKTLPVYGEGNNVRDWLFVRDHARALWAVLQHGRIGEKYNVGARNERTNIQVVQQICNVLDRLSAANAPHDRLITFVPDRPGHDQRYAIDPRKLEIELGWRAEETFETGIEKTIRWYLENEWWWRPLRESVYDGERLGLLPQTDHAI